VPYIRRELRNAIKDYEIKPSNAGELNFLVSTIVIEYLGSQPDYQKFNDAVGVLELAKAELVRRSVGPYEDMKIESNGDLNYPWKKIL